MSILVFWLFVGVSRLMGVGPDDPFVKGFETQAECEEWVAGSATPPDALGQCIKVELKTLAPTSKI